jgi:hypothetical protein
MDSYYVNMKAQPTGEHEVHRSTCSYLPAKENLRYLGDFYDCFDAIIEAKKWYATVDGCAHCCRECHQR